MLTFGPCIFQAIVDAALRHGRPFAVVPCCVYRSAFAPRYLRSGEVVVSLAHFCRYLLEKVRSHPPVYLPHPPHPKPQLQRHFAAPRSRAMPRPTRHLAGTSWGDRGRLPAIYRPQHGPLPPPGQRLGCPVCCAVSHPITASPRRHVVERGRRSECATGWTRGECNQS